MNYNEIGFISKRQGWFNIRKSTNVTGSIKNMMNKTHIITSTDAKKEFEKT